MNGQMVDVWCAFSPDSVKESLNDCEKSVEDLTADDLVQSMPQPAEERLLLHCFMTKDEAVSDCINMWKLEKKDAEITIRTNSEPFISQNIAQFMLKIGKDREGVFDACDKVKEKAEKKKQFAEAALRICTEI